MNRPRILTATATSKRATAMDKVDITVRNNRVEVRHMETDELLAWCYIGHDEDVEMIADMLSAKRLPKEAAKLRRMAMDARKAPGLPGSVRLKGV